MILKYKFLKEEYDYEVEVEFQDFVDYVKPDGFDGWSLEGREAYTQACYDIFSKSWFSLEQVEKSADFIEFMKIKYYMKAKQELGKEGK